MEVAASSSSLNADRVKQGVGKQLDHLLAPLIRVCRFPVPLPTHFQEPASPGEAAASMGSSPQLLDTSSRYGFASALAGSNTTTGPRRPHTTAANAEQDEAQRAERAKLASTVAYRACVQQVPGLARLEDRLSEGRAAGAECEASLQQLLTSLGSMLEVTKSVQSQSENLNQNASALLLRKTRLEKVRDELEHTIQHFTHIEDLVREAEDPMLSATSSRFPTLAEDLNAEMTFLVRHAKFKSAPVYAANTARAQQRIMWTLRTALRTAMQLAARTTTQSDAYAQALRLSQTHIIDKATATTTTVTSETDALVPADEDEDDEAAHFAAALAEVNAVFMNALSDSEPLRRIAELLIGVTQSAATEAFGDTVTPRGSLTREAFLTDVLNAFRDARVAVVCPLLRAWVVASCKSAAPGGGVALAIGAAEPPTPALEASLRGTSLANVDSPRETSAPAIAAGKTPLSATIAPLSTRASSFAGALMNENLTLPYLAGHLCALMDVCLEGERDVLERVWLREEVAATVLPKLVSEVTEEVYHAFRSRLLRVDGIAELAETIQSIQSVPYSSAERDRAQVREIADLWQRMIQDTQERMIFRASIFIRQDIGRARVTPEIVAAYVQHALPLTAPTEASAAQAHVAVGGTADEEAAEDDDQPAMRPIPAVLNTVTLLRCLYPTLEFSVFSTFAEEAIQLALAHLQDLARLVNEQDTRRAGRSQPFLGYACQVTHLLYLRVELSRIDANIVVVEKKLDFAALRRTRLSVTQSSRESKKDVDGELVVASDRLIQNMLATVSSPLEGAARKSAAEAEQAVQRAELALSQCAYALRALLPTMADGTAPAEELLVPVREHLDDLLATVTPAAVRTSTAGAGAATTSSMAPAPAETEPVAGSLEEAARTATVLAGHQVPGDDAVAQLSGGGGGGGRSLNVDQDEL